MSSIVRAALNGLLTFGSIACCLIAGKWLNALVGGLPASLFGMLLFAALLATGWLDEARVAPVIARCIYWMPLIFLPVCAGVLQYGDLVADIGLTMLVLGVTTALLTMALVGFLAQKLLRRPDA